MGRLFPQPVPGMGPAISLSGRVRRAAPARGRGAVLDTSDPVIFEQKAAQLDVNIGLRVGPYVDNPVSLMEAPPAYLRNGGGVTSHLEELDVFIVRYSEHWRLERMTIVDRNLLRLAIYELLYQPNIPVKVVINEAVEMAKRYGSEASGGFVNGILDQVRMSVGREV